MKKGFTVKDLAQIGLVAAIYVVLTLAVSPLSYGSIQFRFSEVLILLCFYNKKYGYGLSLGCLIANCFSPLGWPDIVFGTLSTIIPVILICFSKHLFVSTLWPTLAVGLIVGAEISIIYQLPFFICVGEVALGEFVCVSLIGYPLFKGLEKKKVFMEAIDSTRQSSDYALTTEDFLMIALTTVTVIMFFCLPMQANVDGDNITLFVYVRDSYLSNLGVWYILVFVLPVVSVIFALFVKWKWTTIITSLLSLGTIVLLIYANTNDIIGVNPLYWFIVYGLVLIGIPVLHILKISHLNRSNEEESL